MEDSILTAILVATIVAGTPLIITALGELITEKSGVLNLGAEGMMAVGAIVTSRRRITRAARRSARSREAPPAHWCR
jgi:simple sugar transport system permease protein